MPLNCLLCLNAGVVDHDGTFVPLPVDAIEWTDADQPVQFYTATGSTDVDCSFAKYNGHYSRVCIHTDADWFRHTLCEYWLSKRELSPMYTRQGLVFSS